MANLLCWFTTAFEQGEQLFPNVLVHTRQYVGSRPAARSAGSKLFVALLFATMLGATPNTKAASIVGGEIEVILHSSAQFAAAGIGLGLIAPTAPGSAFPVLVFQITGGDTSTGRVELGGGVIFSDGQTELEVTNFVVDLVAGTTNVDTSIDGGPNETVIRSNNFGCADHPDSCFDVDGITPINDPAFSGLVFSSEARARLQEAFPGSAIDFDAMLPDVSRVTSLHLVPIPSVLGLFVLGVLSTLARRRIN